MWASPLLVIDISAPANRPQTISVGPGRRLPKEERMTRILLIATCVLAFGAAVPGFAASNPSGTGPPNQSCEDQPSAPPGFGKPGFSIAESPYNPGSQYDVACYQVSKHH
jgi:hypothetical protein